MIFVNRTAKKSMLNPLGMNLGTFDDEILRFREQQGTYLPIPLLLLAMVIWGMAVQHFPFLWPSIWLGYVVLVFALRWLIEIKLSRSRSISSDKRVKSIVALYGL